MPCNIHAATEFCQFPWTAIGKHDQIYINDGCYGFPEGTMTLRINGWKIEDSVWEVPAPLASLFKRQEKVGRDSIRRDMQIVLGIIDPEDDE